MTTSYSGNRRRNDADSHLMELPDWLPAYAAPGIRDQLMPLTPDVQRAIEKMSVSAPEVGSVRELLRAKGWAALGASDPGGRSAALDLLGFEQQLVFPTFALFQFYFSKDLDVVYGGFDALNRAMADFCSDDERLLPVGTVSFRDVPRAIAALDMAIDRGCRAIWFPASTSGGRSPAHVDHDPIWARLEEAGIPFVLHIGAQQSTLPSAWHDNGRPLPLDHTGGGENLRAKDFPSAHHAPETFLSCLVLDGVLERFPSLRGGVIELGASWVPGFLRGIDHAVASFNRLEPMLSELSLRPSDYVRRQLKFTPFKFEDVGWLIEQAGDELFMFSSDYPHPEGGRDPIADFDQSLEGRGLGEEVIDRFYAANFDEFIGSGVNAHRK